VIVAATPVATAPPTVSLLRLLPGSDARGIDVAYRSNAPRVTLFVQDANDLQTFTTNLPGTGTAVLPVNSLPKSGAFSIVVQARGDGAVGAAEIWLPSAAFAPVRTIEHVPTASEPLTVTPRWVVAGATITISRYATLGTTTIAIERADETTVELTTLPPGRRTAFLQAPEVGRYTVAISTTTGAATDTSILPLVVIPAPAPTP